MLSWYCFMPMDADHRLDARGLRCPLPLLRTRQQLRGMQSGQLLLVVATDEGSWRDIPAYLGQSSHELVHSEEGGGEFRFWIRVEQDRMSRGTTTCRGGA